MGCRNHPYWRIIVQGDKKKLTGRYIEDLGFWQPRAGKLVKRSIALNKHKVRYWLSVGAQPTRGVERLLHKFGSEFYPKPVVPFGSASLYDREAKDPYVHPYKDMTEKPLLQAEELKYKALLAAEMNRVERKRRIQAEAMANLGTGNHEQDIELVKTDDMESEEMDIFERVKTFEELQRRFQKHRKEKGHLRGNDLRYNIYLKKMNKLTRKDLGLDVEAYKDYVNNLKAFAKYNQDYEILAEDELTSLKGTANGPLGKAPEFTETEESLIHKKMQKQAEERVKQMRNTVGKLARGFHCPILDKDRDILNQFHADPKSFLDYSADLALDLKLFQEKRKLEISERRLIGTQHFMNLTKKDLERNGVSQREYDMIKKLLELDPDMFAVRTGLDYSPYTYTVDLSKYEDKKIPQDCKEMLFRPQKMRRLYERYWQLAPELLKQKAEKTKSDKKLRWNNNNNERLPKTDEEYKLMDEVLETLDKLTTPRPQLDDTVPYDDLKKEFDKNLTEADYADGFEYHANQILK